MIGEVDSKNRDELNPLKFNDKNFYNFFLDRSDIGSPHQYEAMEKKYDQQFQIVFEAIKQLIDEDKKPKRKIGYVKEKQASYSKKRTKN